MNSAIIDFNRTLYDPDRRVFLPEAFELLQFLRDSGYKIALISVDSGNNSDRIKPVAYFFDFIKILRNKTLGDFEEVAKALLSKPKDILVIGDRVKFEIKIGNQLGMKTLWLRTGKFANETPKNELESPTYTFTALTEVISFLKDKKIGG